MSNDELRESIAISIASELWAVKHISEPQSNKHNRWGKIEAFTIVYYRLGGTKEQLEQAEQDYNQIANKLKKENNK